MCMYVRVYIYLHACVYICARESCNVWPSESGCSKLDSSVSLSLARELQEIHSEAAVAMVTRSARGVLTLLSFAPSSRSVITVCVCVCVCVCVIASMFFFSSFFSVCISVTIKGCHTREIIFSLGK